MQDIRDSLFHWLIAAAAFLVTGGAWSLVPLCPLPLSIMLGFVGVMIFVVGLAYFIAGCLSGYVGFRTIKGSNA